MRSALPIGAWIVTTRHTCAWPDCTELAEAQGYCAKHRLRVQRGRTPGCESQWEELVAAALAFADADEGQVAKAETRLKAAAVSYRHQAKPYKRHKANNAPRTQVERDVERARERLAAKGISVEPAKETA